MMAGWTDNMMKTWSDAQKKYWDAWAEMARMGKPPMAASLNSSDEPAWGQGLDQWWKAVSPYLTNVSTQDAFQRMMDMGKVYMNLAENAFKVQQTGVNDQEALEAWLQGLETGFKQYASQLESGKYSDMGFGVGQAAMDNWQKVLKSINLPNFQEIGTAGLRVPSAQDWQETLNKLLNTPALGMTRESQARSQALVKLALNYQAAVDAYLKAHNKQGFASVEALRERMQVLATGGEKITNLRDLYNLWVEVNEAVYGKFAMSDEYQVVYGDMVNTMMELRQGINQELDAYYQSVNLPTRKELNAAYEKQQALRRELRELRQQVQALSRQAAKPKVAATPSPSEALVPQAPEKPPVAKPKVAAKAKPSKLVSQAKPSKPKQTAKGASVEKVAKRSTPSAKSKAPLSKASSTKPKEAVDASKLDQVELPNLTLPVLESVSAEHQAKPIAQAVTQELSTLSPTATASVTAPKSVKKPVKTKKPSAPNAK
jgi:class III poly(R)-hydroxyalkanoic acid synthase PhaE subunit